MRIHINFSEEDKTMKRFIVGIVVFCLVIISLMIMFGIHKNNEFKKTNINRIYVLDTIAIVCPKYTKIYIGDIGSRVTQVTIRDSMDTVYFVYPKSRKITP